MIPRIFIDGRMAVGVSPVAFRPFFLKDKMMSDKPEILVVEDEEDLLELVAHNLSRGGYTVHTAQTGEAGLKLARELNPDLVLLDIMLPGMDGLAVCRRLKDDGATRSIPVMMMTAKGEESDIIAGLETGADDYITKPFSQKVLSARVKAVLRRGDWGDGPTPETSSGEVLKLHDLLIHHGRREVSVFGRPVELTFSEFGILAFLAKRPGWVFTRGQIVDAVRGENHPVTERSVDVLIVGLRKKMGQGGDWIETVRGVGYRIKE